MVCFYIFCSFGVNTESDILAICAHTQIKMIYVCMCMFVYMDPSFFCQGGPKNSVEIIFSYENVFFSALQNI